MIRYRLFLDFAKEEAWLSEMARQGWELTGFYLGYHFKEVKPQDTLIRIDFRQFSRRDEFLNYVTLFEDSGWQHIAGSTSSGSQYFKRLSADSSEDIFSDRLSRAERYKRLSHFWLFMALFFLMMMVAISASGAWDWRALLQPSRLYLTPGLWEKSGLAFWRAFLFETPFALFRAVLLFGFPLTMIPYLVLAMKSNSLYRKEKENVAEA